MTGQSGIPHGSQEAEGEPASGQDAALRVLPPPKANTSSNQATSYSPPSSELITDSPIEEISTLSIATPAGDKPSAHQPVETGSK